MSYYKIIADKGDPRAQYIVGTCYLFEEDIPFNPQAAAKYLQLASDQGVARASYLLGLMYKEGEDLAKNINTAITMMRKAASLGDNDAKKWLVDNGYGE